MGNSQGKESTNPSNIETSPHVQKILEAREKLSGWERVQLIFERDDFGGVSPELQRILHTMMVSAVVGALIGGMGRGRIAHMNFMRSNAHEVFETPLEAKRKLQDNVTLGMGSGAFRVGWRLTLFTTIYMSITTFVSTYRGKMGIIDQVAGASTAGFLYKLPQGPKAQISGAAIGGLLGVAAGVITLGVTKLTGETIDTVNLRYYHHLAKKEQQNAEAERAVIERLAKIDKPIGGDELIRREHDDLARFHDQLFAALGADDEILKPEEEDDNQENNNSTSPQNNKTQVKVDKTNSTESKVVSEVLTSKSNNTQQIASSSVKT